MYKSAIFKSVGYEKTENRSLVMRAYHNNDDLAGVFVALSDKYSGICL